MAILAGFAFGFVLPMFGTGEMALKWPEQQEQKTIFGFGLLAWFGIALLDLYVSFGLYQVFPSKISGWSSVFRITYTLGLLIAIIHLNFAYQSLSFAEGASDFERHLGSFHEIWSKFLVIFGFHLILLGSVLKLKWLAYLLYLGGASYVVVNFGINFIPQASESFILLSDILSLPMALGELLLALLLIFKPKWLKP